MRASEKIRRIANQILQKKFATDYSEFSTLDFLNLSDEELEKIYKGEDEDAINTIGDLEDIWPIIEKNIFVLVGNKEGDRIIVPKNKTIAKVFKLFGQVGNFYYWLIHTLILACRC